MGMMEGFVKNMIRSMSPQERYDFMEMAITELLSSMSSEERRELMIYMVPEMFKNMMEGMTQEDRKMVVEELAPALLFQLSSYGAFSSILEMMRPKKE